ncbi:MAG: dipeptide/oligopeptide/nickel ABC transporter ATP-binding protein [Spirochaetaceae bacterium]|jgi:ABC-type glutathione transport system ATPase component|nr:dipeptide/oligopeptide/nickel ABC transporter ATP-binding protein [Spirochaetaceae bacterium]
MAPLLSVKNLAFSYADRNFGPLGKKILKPVLHGISFKIEEGEIFGLVGASGAGKSTLGKCLLGLLDYTGDIFIDGIRQGPFLRPGQRKLLAARVQGVFQNPGAALNPVMPIGRLLDEAVRTSGVQDKTERGKRSDEILELVGLDSSVKKRRADELSSGQKQRVCIGCALSFRPRLIIADEAVSSLDVSAGAQILNLFSGLRERLGLALLFISHNLEAVHYLSDRVAVLEGGTLTGDGQDPPRLP